MRGGSHMIMSKTSSNNHKSLPEHQAFLEQCYTVIKQQQDHITELEKMIEKKETLIDDLVKKSQRQEKKEKKIQTDAQQERDVLELEINKLSHQIQYLSHDNENLRVELQAKDAQLLQASQTIRQAESKVEEGRQSLEKLKEIYDAKVAKLVNELKNKVQEGVTASIQKSRNRNLCSTVTPLKMLGKLEETMNDPLKTLKQNSRRLGLASTANKTLINSPYLEKQPKRIKELSYRIDKFCAQTDSSSEEEEIKSWKQKTIRGQQSSSKYQGIDTLNSHQNNWQQKSVQSAQKIKIMNVLDKLGQKIKKFSEDELAI